MLRARQAVCGYYRDHGARPAAEQIVLTTSTSEGYSWLFRLLCDPGDEVLIAQPSYPLFDLLATIDDVRLAPYALLFDPGSAMGGRSAASHSWSLDIYALRQQIKPRTRAIIVVHPNNPTGHYTTAHERVALMALCREHGLALIVDEVFLDYPFRGYEGAASSFAAGEHEALTFVLSGLSKVAALPQMKASWIACFGQERELQDAMRRLEIVADTFLSMNAPVQYALPGWLAGRHAIQQQIHERVQQNLLTLDRAIASEYGLQRIACEGGWYATLRTPPFEADEALAVRLLEEHGVAVHPGSFFGFAERNRLVLSLLSEPEVLGAGILGLVAAVRAVQ
jgi:aspartate/methionine/tyrosine aminotransferase